MRISASLDLEIVLREVVESARALTGARLGGITTIDEAGAPQNFVTSGLTEAEHRGIAEWSDGPRLFERFRDLEGPLRSADFPAYLHALGFPSDRLPLKVAQITPMRHRGVHVGIFYLAEKAGGEPFTDEDEEILVLFAAQAATAVANARTYRAEHRARADLEALIETSPVGVVVFEARTGALVSLNREAARIVQDLCDPGQSAEQLLGVITCRRADGREIALDRLPLARALDRAETVRADGTGLDPAPRRARRSDGHNAGAGRRGPRGCDACGWGHAVSRFAPPPCLLWLLPPGSSRPMASLCRPLHAPSLAAPPARWFQPIKPHWMLQTGARSSRPPYGGG